MRESVKDAVTDDIEIEMAKSVALHEKHSVYPSDPLRRTALMCEEAGEALKAALDLTRRQRTGALSDIHTAKPVADMRKDLYTEVTQTAVMAIRLLQAMKEEDGVEYD
jgi:hypothetical protein